MKRIILKTALGIAFAISFFYPMTFSAKLLLMYLIAMIYSMISLGNAISYGTEYRLKVTKIEEGLSKKKKELEKEIKSLSELMDLSEKKRESLNSLITEDMMETEKKIKKDNIAIASFFFFFGVSVTIIIQFIFS